MDIQQKRLIGAKILGGITLILMLISQPRYEISIDIIGFTLPCAIRSRTDMVICIYSRFKESFLAIIIRPRFKGG